MDLLSVSTVLSFPGFQNQRDNTVCSLLWRDSFTQSVVLILIHVVTSMRSSFYLLLDSIHYLLE